MFCANCGKKIEGQGVVCPECVAELGVDQANAISRACLGGNAPAVQAAVEHTEPAAPAYEAPAAPVYEAPAYTAPEAPAYTAPAVPTQPTPGFTLSAPADGVKKSGKKSKKGLVIGLGILALVLVVGIVVVALNWNNWFGKGSLKAPVDIPEDPEDYIAYLHEPQMAGMAEDLAKLYSAYMGTSQPTAYESTLKLTLGDDLLELLEDAIAESGLHMDMSWLKDIRLNVYGSNPGDGTGSAALELALGNTRILGADYAMDLEDMIMYMSIPELSKDAVKIDMNEMAEAAVFDNRAIMAQLAEDMPSEQEIQALLEDYGEIVLSYMTDVHMDEVTLTAGKAEQEVTVLTVDIAAEDLMDMFVELLECSKEHKTVRKIGQAYVNYTNAYCDAGLYGEEMRATMADFEAFLDEGIATFEELATEAQDGDYMRLITYADGADILGISLVLFEDEELVFQEGYIALTKGNTQYLEAKLEIEGLPAPLTFSGSGKISKGKLTGEYVLEMDGDEIAVVNLKGVDMETGLGTYEITPSASFVRGFMRGMQMSDMVGALASDVTLRIDLGEGKIGLAVLVDDAELLGIELSMAEAKAKKVTFPKNAIDVTDDRDMERWAEDLDLNQILDNLKKAGLPNAIYRLLQQAMF